MLLKKTVVRKMQVISTTEKGDVDGRPLYSTRSTLAKI